MNPQEQGERLSETLIASKYLLTEANAHIQQGKRLMQLILASNKHLISENERLSTQITSAKSENARLLSEIETLYDKIKHGDSEHQAWLKKAIAEHFSQGAGDGNKAAELITQWANEPGDHDEKVMDALEKNPGEKEVK